MIFILAVLLWVAGVGLVYYEYIIGRNKDLNVIRFFIGAIPILNLFIGFWMMYQRVGMSGILEFLKNNLNYDKP